MAFNLDRKIKEFIPVWNENRKQAEPIKLELKFLDIENYCELIDISQGARENIEKGKIKDFSSVGKLASRMLPVFKTNIVKISNLTIDNRPIKIEELVLSPEFIELNSEIMNEMILNTMVSDTDKKK